MKGKRIKCVIYTILTCLTVILYRTRAENTGGLIEVEQKNKATDEENDYVISVKENAEDEKMRKLFEATDEWREIEPNEDLPRGLHVRINLQTGKKEAKLMKKEDVNSKKITLSDEMREAIKGFEADDVEISPGAENKFKNVDQLKKDFKDLKLDMKTDYEVMKELLDGLRNLSFSDEKKIFIFSDLEYYVHQFDNAQDFIQMKGIETIIPAFNSTNSELRAMAAFVLGSAMQSNPKVQIACLESGLLPILLRKLVFDDLEAVKSRSMYALSCLIRHFPLAQQHFLDQGGLTALAKLFDVRQQSPDIYKLQVKVVTLLSDLIEEQLLTAIHKNPNEKYQNEKLKQYNK